MQNNSELLIRALDGSRLHSIVDNSVLAWSHDRAVPETINEFSFGAAASTDDSENLLRLKFRNGGGFYCGQFERQGGNSYGDEPVKLNFDNAFWTAGAHDLDITPSRSDCVTLDVRAGGLELEVQESYQTTVHRAFTGVGDIVKSGTGALYFGLNLRITKPSGTPNFYQNITTNVAKRAYTLNCGSAVHVKGGLLLLNETAVKPGIGIALEGGSVACTANAATSPIISGVGSVTGQTLTSPIIAFDPSKTSDIVFTDCTITGKGRIRLKSAPVNGRLYRISTWTGSSPFPAGELWKAVFDGGDMSAKVTVNGDSVIWTRFAHYETMVIMR